MIGQLGAVARRSLDGVGELRRMGGGEGDERPVRPRGPGGKCRGSRPRSGLWRRPHPGSPAPPAPPPDVRCSLLSAPTLARGLGQDALLGDSHDPLLWAQAGEGLSLSLYLDAGMLERLESAQPLDQLRAELLDDLPWYI